MPCPKGSKNKFKIEAADYATQIAEKQPANGKTRPYFTIFY